MGIADLPADLQFCDEWTARRANAIKEEKTRGPGESAGSWQARGSGSALSRYATLRDVGSNGRKIPSTSSLSSLAEYVATAIGAVEAYDLCSLQGQRVVALLEMMRRTIDVHG